MVEIEELPLDKSVEKQSEPKEAREPLGIEVVEHKKKPKTILGKLKRKIGEKLEERRLTNAEKKKLQLELELFLVGNGVSQRTARGLAKRIVRRGDLTPEQAIRVGMAIDEEREKMMMHRAMLEAERRRLAMERRLAWEDEMERMRMAQRARLMEMHALRDFNRMFNRALTTPPVPPIPMVPPQNDVGIWKEEPVEKEDHSPIPPNNRFAPWHPRWVPPQYNNIEQPRRRWLP